MAGYIFPDYAIAYVVAAVLSFVAAAVTWNRRANPGNIAFALVLMSLCIWSFASIFEAGGTVLSEKYFWSKWQYIGVASLPALWLYFAAEFTHQKIFTIRVRNAILVLPIITLFMALTNEQFHLLWSNVYILPGPLHIAKYVHGPWFYVHVIYSYFLLLLGTYWLVKALLKLPPNQRIQVYIIFTGLFLGWAANILYVTGLFPTNGLDTTPLSFTFIAFILSWNIFRFRLFNIVPLARDLLLDNMADGVIVLDPNNIIIDINPAAKAMIGMEKSHSFLGLTLREALVNYADIIDQFKGKTDYSTEIKISEDPPRYLGFSVTTIRDSQKNDLGEIIVLFDITERKLIEAREEEQRKLAEALANTAAVINSTLNLDEVLEKILENVDKVVPHDAANIALIDANNNVRFEKIKGYGKYGTEKIVQSIECCVDEIHNLRQMAETHKASFNPNTDIDPEWKKDVPGSSWIKSYMGAPICAKGQLIGFINLDAETPYFFKKEYIPRLEAFANQVAVAIQNAQYFQEIAESAQEMSILYQVGLAVTSGLGVEKTVSTLFNQLKNIVPIDLFFIALLDDKKENAIYTMLQKDGRKIDFGPVSMKDRPSITRYVLEKGKTVYIPDILSKDAEFPENKIVKIPDHDERSILGIPLILRDAIQGVLFLQATVPEAYSEDQIRLLETIANQASIVIDNAQLFEKVQVMAVTDSLTGAYNRRYFFTTGENEIIRAQRYGSALSLIMLDIDHFKLVNDHFGHPCGDKVLIMITRACSSVLRKVDILCRFGGEEFVVLLPETALDAAVIAAERIRQAISEQRLSTENGEVKVTVSIGAAELQAKTETLENLVDKADKALYQAKGEGRNCVRVFKP